MSESEANRREFLLYWVGLFVIALAVVSIFISIGNLVASVLSYNCYIPVVSGMLGIPPPPPTPLTNPVTVTSSTTFSNFTMPNNGVAQQLPPYPYYCTNPYIPAAVLTFMFDLLSSLVFIGVGAYMMLNGKKR